MIQNDSLISQESSAKIPWNTTRLALKTHAQEKGNNWPEKLVQY